MICRCMDLHPHHLKPGGTPIDESDASPALHGGYGGVHVLGHHVASVQQAARHVLAVARVALHHLVLGLEQFCRDF